VLSQYLSSFRESLSRRPVLYLAFLAPVVLLAATFFGQPRSAHFSEQSMRSNSTSRSCQSAPEAYSEQDRFPGHLGQGEGRHRGGRHHGPPPPPPGVPPTVLFLVGGALGYLIGRRRHGCRPHHPHHHCCGSAAKQQPNE